MNFLKSPPAPRGRGRALLDSCLRLIGPVVPDKKLDLPELWGPELQEWMRALPWGAGAETLEMTHAQRSTEPRPEQALTPDGLLSGSALPGRGRGPPSATPPGLPAQEAGLGEGPHVGGSHAQWRRSERRQLPPSGQGQWCTEPCSRIPEVPAPAPTFLPCPLQIRASVGRALAARVFRWLLSFRNSRADRRRGPGRCPAPGLWTPESVCSPGVSELQERAGGTVPFLQLCRGTHSPVPANASSEGHLSKPSPVPEMHPKKALFPSVLEELH